MTRYSLFIISILLGLLSATAAVPGRVRGNVADAVTSEPLSGVIVRSKGAFTSTDREGRFTLTLKPDADSVSFRLMGYQTLTLPATADMSAVRLAPKATQLNDVIVEAPDIYARGDTLVFNVGRYAKAEDNAIIDVIKRLPGIKVDDDGTIRYQGKPINKFYIDGNDLIGGRYGLATNNISHEDVKSVEVMENHQPIKALEGIEFPEEAGINLKLKEDACSRWVGVAQGGLGVQPLLFNASLFTMRMAPKVQNMFTLKADNTGWNPANEIREHDFDDMFSSGYATSLWPEYIAADAVDAPLAENRTRDNLSWLANAITAWRAGDTSMRLQCNYMGDRLDYRSGMTTDYLSSDIPDFVRDNKLHTRSHDLSAQFFSETNKRGYYLKDRLDVGVVTNRTASAVTGTMDLDQRVNRNSVTAVNDLKLVKRNEKRLFTLISRNSFGHRPDRLVVAGEEDALQRVATTDFRSTTESRMGRLTRFWKYYLTAGLDIDVHRMNSTLAGLGAYDNSGIHNAFLSTVYAIPGIDFERDGWRASFGLPLKWHHYSVAGQHDYVNAAPRLYVRRQLTAKSELSASVAYRLTSPAAYLEIDAPMLADYRNLFVASNPGGYSHDAAATVSWRYRNPVKALFMNLSATYNYRRSSLMSNQIFAGDMIVSCYADRVSDNTSWYAKGGISKGFGHSRMVAGLDIDASTSSASSMRDGEVIPYRQTTAGIKPYFKGSLIRWLSVSYEADYGFTRLSIAGHGNSSHTFRHNLSATVVPADQLQFTAGMEQYVTRFPEGNTASLLLADASAVWTPRNGLRLSLTAANLLDSRDYRYVTYGTLARSEHRFRLRPRTILLTLQHRF